MKRFLSGLLTFALLLSMAIPAAAKTIVTENLIIQEENLGCYGKHLYPNGSRIEPQINIYEMIRAELAANPGAESISLDWEATPLHFSTYFLNEAMLALQLDHPELNTGSYKITDWRSTLVTNYVARLDLKLTRKSPLDVDQYQAGITEAMTHVGTGTNYEKAKNAFHWLLDNCTYGGSNQAEGIFADKQADGVGFTNAFKVLMDQAGVPCRLGWNNTFQRVWAYAQMDDGKWYVVDMSRAAQNKDNMPSRYFLCADSYNYSSNESFPQRMWYVGRGSGVSPASQPYMASDDTITVTLPKQPDENGFIRLENGAIRILDGVKTTEQTPQPLLQQHNQLPAGSVLTVQVTPASGSMLDTAPLAGLISYTTDPNVILLENMRESIAPIFSFKPDPSTQVPIKVIQVLPAAHGVLEVTLQEEAEAPPLEIGKNPLPQDKILHIKPIPDIGYETAKLQVDVYNVKFAEDGGIDTDGNPIMIPFVEEVNIWDKDTVSDEFDKPDGADSTAYFYKPINKILPNGVTLDGSNDEVYSHDYHVRSLDISAVFEPMAYATIKTQDNANGAVLVEQKTTETDSTGNPIYAPLTIIADPVNPGQAIEATPLGTDLRITLQPAQGYESQSVTVNVAGQPQNVVTTDKNNVFLLPGDKVTGNVTITPAFAPVHDTPEQVPVTGVALSANTATLYSNRTGEGLSYQTLVATLTPSNATNQAVAWTSSDAGIATVDNSGKVTAVANGQADITVTTQDGAYTATCKVTVATHSDNSSSGGSGGGGGAASSSKPDTTTNADGSVTTTVTDSKSGAVTTTTKAKDGSITTLETKKDGTVTETVQRKDGTKAITITSTDGKTTANVTLPQQAITNGDTVLPLSPLPVGGNTQVTVTLPKGQGASVTVPLQAAGPGVVAALVGQDGSRKIIRTSYVGKQGLVVPLATTETGAFTLQVIDNSKRFTDVPANHWAANAVAFASGHELLQGNTASAFVPGDSMSRAMLITALYRLSGEPQTAVHSIPDVAASAWYAKAVSWALENNIAIGNGNGFAPESAVSREELASMLYRYAKTLPGYTAQEQSSGLSFADVISIQPWATESVSWAANAGIISGKPGNLLDPNGAANRGEVATMLMRFITGLN